VTLSITDISGESRRKKLFFVLDSVGGFWHNKINNGGKNEMFKTPKVQRTQSTKAPVRLLCQYLLHIKNTKNFANANESCQKQKTIHS
jgi:hypothetical protein